ncbi:MAG: conjugal transfer protein TraD [Phenylobacterium sp.]|uniref:conjugal transfer protein TraD n=1 Tax=Phenylobacterium sp. TaxID=1871053 RepID=UPI0025CC3C30|nr:conjugal transfer protein TraD [Phenylobacterium sp.]MBA4013258.1 conjugal transfer protein TraD [Phenylobacterium sp.]
MRKPRDIDAELRALAQKARDLKTRRVNQMGELVIATAGERITLEILAGLLLTAQDAPPADKEVWRAKGEAFFRKLRQRSTPTPATPGEPHSG